MSSHPCHASRGIGYLRVTGSKETVNLALPNTVEILAWKPEGSGVYRVHALLGLVAKPYSAIGSEGANLLMSI